MIILSAVFLASISGCGLWKRFAQSDPVKNSETDSEVLTNIPFSTREPEKFRAEIVISSFTGDKKNVQKYVIARKDGKSLRTFYQGSKNERTILRTADNKTYLINHQTKNYRELDADQALIFSDDKLIKNLTSKWLNEKASARFEKLDTENKLTKYRVKLENSKNSEILIYVDKKLNFPVKQEFFNIAEGKRNLTFSIEIKNFTTEVNDGEFSLIIDH